MKKSKATTLLFGAMLLLGLGSANLLASDSKCGAGKCGDAKKEMPASKCGADKKEMQSSKCGDAKKEMATSKCGGDKKEAPKSTGKCGVGKCG
jgi:uncharacterized low-complexity protein